MGNENKGFNELLRIMVIAVVVGTLFAALLGLMKINFDKHSVFFNDRVVEKVNKATAITLIDNPESRYKIFRMERYGRCYEIFQNSAGSFVIEIDCKNWRYPGE